MGKFDFTFSGRPADRDALALARSLRDEARRGTIPVTEALRSRLQLLECPRAERIEVAADRFARDYLVWTSAPSSEPLPDLLGRVAEWGAVSVSDLIDSWPSREVPFALVGASILFSQIPAGSGGLPSF